MVFGGASAGTLETVSSAAAGVRRQRGLCRILLSGLPGKLTKGLDVDYCRALAAGIFGDANKVRYVALTAQNRLPAAIGRDRRALSKLAQTYLRGVTLGLRQGPVNSMTVRVFCRPGATAA